MNILTLKNQMIRKILDRYKIEKIGMRGLLGVSQGSSNDPRVVIFEWNLKEKIKPTILVGKGVTFDTGGISIKPSVGMEEMITDMGGSAVVVGSMINEVNFLTSIIRRSSRRYSRVGFAPVDKCAICIRLRFQ